MYQVKYGVWVMSDPTFLFFQVDSISSESLMQWSTLMFELGNFVLQFVFLKIKG